MRPVVLAIVMIAVAVAAGFFALSLQESLEDYKPVLTNDQSRLKATIGQPGDGSNRIPEWAKITQGSGRLTQRLVLVVIDGLRADVSNQMPFLNELRSLGVETTVVTGQPSYSKPGYSVLSSGAWQEINGVTLNSHSGAMTADSIFASAQRSGLTTAGVADDWWLEVNGEVFNYRYFYPDSQSHDPLTDESAYENALHSLRHDRADLTLVHFCQVDTQAHESGGAMTGRYLAAALHIDEFLRGIVSELDLSKETLIVTSDHGHLGRNNGGGSGHGGWEVEVTTSPLIMVGAGISPGEFGRIRQIDVTATASALLGIPPPAQSQGRIAWEALSASSRDKAANQIMRAGTYGSFAAEYVRAAELTVPGEVSRFGETQAKLDKANEAFVAESYDEAFAEATDSFESTSHAVDEMRMQRIAGERIPRSIAALAYLLVTLFVATRFNRVFKIGFFAGGLFSVVIALLLYLYVFDNAFSLSVFPDAGISTFVEIFGLPIWIGTIVAYLVGAVLLAVVQPRSMGWTGPGWGSWRITLADRLLQAQFLVLGSMYFLSLLAVLSIAVNGLRVTWYIPDLRVGFAGLYAAMQVALLAPLGIVLPLLTLSGAGLSRLFGTSGRSRMAKG